jgi:AcrR family transcriptional regulator
MSPARGRARRATYHHGDLPAALVKASLEIIAKDGVQDFSLREAARRVGVDPAACYRHFKNREAVLQAVAREGFSRLAVRMEAATRTARTPEEGLHRLGVAYVGFALDHPGHFRTMLVSGELARNPERRGEGESGRTPFELTLHWLTLFAADAGLKLDAERVSNPLWAGVHGVAMLLLERAWQPATRAELDALVADCLDTFIAGVKARFA